jgi:hypothetical protein
MNSQTKELKKKAAKQKKEIDAKDLEAKTKKGRASINYILTPAIQQEW